MNNYIQKFAKKLEEKEQSKKLSSLCEECKSEFSDKKPISSICVSFSCICSLCKDCDKKHAIQNNHLIEDVHIKQLTLRILQHIFKTINQLIAINHKIVKIFYNQRIKDQSNISDPKVLERINKIFPLFTSMVNLRITFPYNINQGDFLITILSVMQRSLNQLQQFHLQAVNGDIFNTEVSNGLGRIFYIQNLKEVNLKIGSSIKEYSTVGQNSQSSQEVNHFLQLIQQSHSQNLEILKLNMQDRRVNLIKLISSINSLTNLKLFKFKCRLNQDINSELEFILLIKNLSQLKKIKELTLNIKDIQNLIKDNNIVQQLILSLNTTLSNIRKFSLKDSQHSFSYKLFDKCNYLTKCDKQDKIPLRLAYLKKQSMIKQIQLYQKHRLLSRKEMVKELCLDFYL